MKSRHPVQRKKLSRYYGDVFFECPSCKKSMVTGSEGQGGTVDCPQCGQKVLVPRRPLPSPTQREEMLQLFRETGYEWLMATKDLKATLMTLIELQEAQLKAAKAMTSLALDLNDLDEYCAKMEVLKSKK